MKYLCRAGILALALLLAIMPLAAAESEFKKGEWVVLEPGEKLYKDLSFTNVWGEAPYYMTVKLAAVGDGIAAVRNGKKIGFLSLEKVTHLREGDALVTERKTRAYKKPSKKSKSIRVPINLVVDFVAISGDCVMVTKNGVTAFMNMNDLSFAPGSRAGGETQYVPLHDFTQ